MLKTAIQIAAFAIAVAAITPLTSANAWIVRGVLTDASGKPLANRQVHFENRVTEDLFLARSGSDGSFSADLPQGRYDLRDEQGHLIEQKIQVKQGDDINLGSVHVQPSSVLEWPFKREGVAPYVVDTEAPATAHVPEVPITPPPPSTAPIPTALPTPTT